MKNCIFEMWENERLSWREVNLTLSYDSMNVFFVIESQNGCFVEGKH